jgi:hypothetical protein
MHAPSFLAFKSIIHQEHMVKGTTINSSNYMKAQQRLKQQMQCVHQGEKSLHLFNMIISDPHTSVATSAAITSDMRL